MNEYRVNAKTVAKLKIKLLPSFINPVTILTYLIILPVRFIQRLNRINTRKRIHLPISISQSLINL